MNINPNSLATQNTLHKDIAPKRFYYKPFNATLPLAIILSMCFFGALQAQTMAPPEIDVAVVATTPVHEHGEFQGKLTAVESVAMRPRVSGQIETIYFTQGSQVSAGETLLEIDPRPFEALLAQAQAQLSRAQANHDRAQREAKRGETLLKRKAISQEVYETRLSEELTTKAQLQAAKAELELRQLDLAYTQVKAPIKGITSIASVTAGNWVQAGQTLLTTLVSDDQLYVEFYVDERSFLAFSQYWELGETTVKVGFLNEQGFPHQAHLAFIDNQIDPNTGTIMLRAKLTGLTTKLKPGLFTRVMIPTRPSYDGIVIDERSIATDQSTRYVLVVDENQTLNYQPIDVGPSLDGMRVVRSGLNPGDKIVVNGLMRVRPGAQITPNIVPMNQHSPATQSNH